MKKRTRILLTIAAFSFVGCLTVNLLDRRARKDVARRFSKLESDDMACQGVTFNFTTLVQAQVQLPDGHIEQWELFPVEKPKFDLSGAEIWEEVINQVEESQEKRKQGLD